MNTAELQAALRELQGERSISFEMLLEALEAALISAYKRNFGGEANAIVTIDRDTGEFKVYHRRAVVEAVADPKLEIAATEAGPRYEAGDFYDEEVTPKNFGRIAAQTAKQVIVQRIREAERDMIFNEYNGKLHDLVSGTVQRYEQRNMFVDLGKTEALLPLSEQVPRENYRINDRITAFVLDVRRTNKGPQIVLSRAAEGLVQRLLEKNVPEIASDIVEIMAIARESGNRSKVAVHSHRAEIDAVGACLGPKSSRIASVSDELRGEKIDIIRWSPDTVTFINNALAPAKVIGVELFEDEGVGLVTVPDYQLSLAIGREGQNVRLAARLTGWRLDITSESNAEEARGRYLAERAERLAEDEEPVAEPEAVEATGEAAIDPELIRKLEEFRQAMLESHSGNSEGA
ncbi:MAG: transcription termination/antitermination protein NusA [Candidatus Eremiobacteraeota bacterium]|nr:transcription termination/antitermination protein NusA [Candidatus Eremiobacteraeota bacterium]